MATVIVLLVGMAIVAGTVLSPVALAMMLVLGLVAFAIGRGLPPAERRVVLTILLVAVALRVAAVAMLFMASDANHVSSFPFDGDGRYVKLRALWIRNVWLGVPIDSSYFDQAFADYGWSSYIYVLAYLQYLLGPAPYAIHLFSISCSVAVVGMLHRLARRAYGPVPAVMALLLMLFLPTLFMWSVSAMKEAWYLLLMTTALIGLERALRGSGAVVRGVAGAAAVAATLALDGTRAGATLILALAVTLAFAGTFVTRRRYVFAASVVMVPLVGILVLRLPPVQSRVLARLRTSAELHIGHVNTEGYSYRLLDQRFYSGDSFESMTWGEAQRFVVRSAASFVFVPLPWQSLSRSQLLFLPQQLIWYGLVLFAAVGLVRACQADLFATWLCLGMTGAGAVVIALNEGNIGTLVRHRDSVVPFVICLSAMGMYSALSWAGVFAPARGSPPRASELDFGLSRAPLPIAHAIASSVVVGFGRRLPLLSAAGALLTRFLRPSLPAAPAPDEAHFEEQWNELTTGAIADGRLGSVLRKRAVAASTTWGDSVLAAQLEILRTVDTWRWLRGLGTALLAGALLTLVTGRAGGHAWPSLFAWGVMVVAALVLIVGARPLETAFRDQVLATPELV